MTGREAAVVLAVAPGSVPRLVRRARLPKARPGERAGLRREDVEALSLNRLRRGEAHPFWMSASEVAGRLGVSGQPQAPARHQRRVPAGLKAHASKPPASQGA